MLTKRVNWIALATAFATAGCADSAMAPLTVARVSVVPSDHNLIPGAMVRLYAVAEAANGTALTGRETHWRSDQLFVASVDATGLVVAVSEGTALVSATIEGKTGVATIRVIGPLGPSRSGISRLIPESVAAGTGDFTLVVQGAGFSPAAQVSWDGSRRLTSFVSASELRAQVLRADVALPIRVPVTVVNEGSNRPVSNALDFRVVTARNPR